MPISGAFEGSGLASITQIIYDAVSPETSLHQRSIMSLLAKSAHGATSLIALQVASRALTFIVNQALLRFLSPQILGVATQLDLFSVSTLYFSRESIRVVLQRGRNDNDKQSEDKKRDETDPSAGRRKDIQEAVNISYIAILLGVVLAFTFQYLYLRKADPAVLSTAYIQKSLNLYAIATILELLHEPYFAAAQSQLQYGIRTSSEMQATFSRCIITCVSAIWASKNNLDLGVLPFAAGQLTYSITLLLGYSFRLSSTFVETSTSPYPHKSSPASSLMPTARLKLASTLYAQSLFKQLLTSGDSYLIATLTTLESQGAYALASNYGGLLARILFQPIEESSRTLFARLLTTSPQTPATLSLKQ
ncbi:uncharacterized protein KY384_002391 [Bacidia gigantensis]|uniref:uncharacterized protein n=1 Tax=Bacidia gigantensis TaxID=2732470 RepID=UPI001D049E5E|nr:uncharacterized protein KY384_002391 [Bacidia gigantensis]KAG8532514.1 hypothetical protein KY384_002391 [Bacidia gigantensis]